MSAPLSLDAVNAMDRDAFVAALGEIFEHAPWVAEMIHDSQREQASAGLAAMTGEEMARMARLNGEYRRRHGIPFIIAARRHTKAQIFDEMERRIDRQTADEFVEAMAQIAYITHLRMRSLVPAT